MNITEWVTTTLRPAGRGPEREGYGSVPTQHSGGTSGPYIAGRQRHFEGEDMIPATTLFPPETSSAPLLAR